MDRLTIYYTSRMPTDGFLPGFDAVIISGINLIVRSRLLIIDKRHSTWIGYVLSPLMTGYGFFGQAPPILNLFGTLTFILADDSGHGTVVQPVTSEILPNNPSVKAKSNGAEAAVITLLWTSMISLLVPSWKIFSICLSCMVLQQLFVRAMPGIGRSSHKCVQEESIAP